VSIQAQSDDLFGIPGGARVENNAISWTLMVW
jgi:hypothetical protein